MTHYFDVATSANPSASGYGGRGASGGIGDSMLRIANEGNIATQQRGTLCAMIYVFDDIEEMQACCGCPVTPDGLRTMSIINNSIQNPGVNFSNLNAGVIDIVSSTPDLFLPTPSPLPGQIGNLGNSGWECDPSFQFGPIIGLTEDADFIDGLRAWITSSEGNVPVPALSGVANLVKGASVNEFQFASFDGEHGRQLFDSCLFLIQNGSGTGACTCGSGDRSSNAPQS